MSCSVYLNNHDEVVILHLHSQEQRILYNSKLIQPRGQDSLQTGIVQLYNQSKDGLVINNNVIVFGSC